MRKLWPVLIMSLFLFPYQPLASQTTRPKLLVMGDSLSVGLFATSEQNGFKHLLANRLSADLASCRGSNLQHIAECWQNYQQWKPDIVVIEIGLNDVSNFNGLALPEAEWTAVYEELAATIKATGARLVLSTMFHGVASTHANYAKYERYNQHIAEIAADSGAMVADLWTATKGCTVCLSQPGVASPFGPYWEGDNFHPSDLGHQIISNTIYGRLGATAERE